MTQQSNHADHQLDQAISAVLDKIVSNSMERESRLLRESLSMLQDYVDPSEAFRHGGETWEPLGSAAVAQVRRTGFANERELADARERCRALAMTNEFAINGHENRISYTIGTGHQYRIVPRIAPVRHSRAGGNPVSSGNTSPRNPDAGSNPTGSLPTSSTPTDANSGSINSGATGSSLPVPSASPTNFPNHDNSNHTSPHHIAAAQEVIDEFLELNAWRKRQVETLRRMDRDGEAFLWFFADPSGRTRVRFIDPELVATPDHLRTDGSTAHDQESAVSFGIASDPDDVETVLAYWVDGDRIPAAEVQHRKSHVDANVRRGVPLFYPVLRTLRWGENLLRNMAAVSDIQTAIALIRKHEASGRSPLEALRSSAATFTADHPTTGRAHFQQFQPGTILDVYANTEYDFPARGLDASRYVLVLQAILRAVASRLVMPEFMLTADASNANYSSTLVAEGPAVKMFERLQHDMMDDDRAVMRRVLQNAAAAGRLPEDILQHVRIQIDPPRIATRDRLKEVQADAILVRAGAITPQQMAARDGEARG